MGGVMKMLRALGSATGAIQVHFLDILTAIIVAAILVFATWSQTKMFHPGATNSPAPSALSGR
jgi:hypothetical protein